MEILKYAGCTIIEELQHGVDAELDGILAQIAVGVGLTSLHPASPLKYTTDCQLLQNRAYSHIEITGQFFLPMSLKRTVKRELLIISVGTFVSHYKREGILVLYAEILELADVIANDIVGEGNRVHIDKHRLPVLLVCQVYYQHRICYPEEIAGGMDSFFDFLLGKLELVFQLLAATEKISHRWPSKN